MFLSCIIVIRNRSALSWYQTYSTALQFAKLTSAYLFWRMNIYFGLFYAIRKQEFLKNFNRSFKFALSDFISCLTIESSSQIPSNTSTTSKNARKDIGSSASIPRGPLNARKLHLYFLSLAVNIRAKGSNLEKV